MEINSEQTGFSDDIFNATLSYWSPKLADAGESIADALGTAQKFWAPRIESAKEFWDPILKTSWKYWEPKLERAAPWIDEKVLGSIRQPVNYLRKKYGEDAAQKYLVILNFMEPRLAGLIASTDKKIAALAGALQPTLKIQRETVREYWKVKAPDLYQTLANTWDDVRLAAIIPVLIYDAYQGWAFENLGELKKVLGQKKHAASPVKNNIDVVEYMMKPSADAKLIARVKDLFEDILPYSSNSTLSAFYKIQVLDSDIPNSFNTGTTIYVSSEMARLLNDDQLRAIIAHEMAHGDELQSFQNLGKILVALGKHDAELISEEAVWFLTGEVGKTLRQVANEGNLAAIMEGFSKNTNAVELEADVKSTEILLRAGFSPEHLIEALMILYGEAVDPNEREDAINKHPDLAERVNAINKAIPDTVKATNTTPNVDPPYANNKTEMSTGDPLRDSWENGSFLHHALLTEKQYEDKKALEPIEVQAITQLVNRFKKYFADQPPEPLRFHMIEKVANHCFSGDWGKAGLDAPHFLLGLSNSELKMLYSATVLIDFLRKEKENVSYSPQNSNLRDFFDTPQNGEKKKRRWDCVSISLISLHMLQSIGVTGFKANTLNLSSTEEMHVNLVLPLESGLKIYLNNGEEFLPHGHWPPNRETTLPPWGAVSWIHDNLAASLGANGSLDESIEESQKALAINPNDAIAHFNLSIAFMTQNKLSEAIPHLQSVTELNPDFAVAYDCLGQIYREWGDKKKAVFYFEKALQKDPENIETRKRLSEALNSVK